MANNAWTGAVSTAFATGGNWLTGAAPTTGDNVVIDGRAQNDLAGGDLSAVTLATLRIFKSCTKSIGTVLTGTMTPLKIGATICEINLPGEGGSTGTGPPTVALDFSTIQTICTVYDARSSGVSGFSCVMLRGTHASNRVVIKGGSVGIGTNVPIEATTVLTLDMDGTSSVVTIGYGVTLTTINQDGGNITLNCAATTINQLSGKLRTQGSGAITTANIAGTFIANSTGTIGTTTVSGNGLADLSESPIARTFTTFKVDGAFAKVSADNGAMRTGSISITFTNGIVCQNGASSDQVDLGSVTLTAA